MGKMEEIFPREVTKGDQDEMALEPSNVTDWAPKIIKFKEQNIMWGFIRDLAGVKINGNFWPCEPTETIIEFK
jgi:hypothetical protein